MQSPSPATLFLLAGVLFLIAVIFNLFFYRSWRRKRELAQPFPQAWRNLLQQQVPIYNRLNADLKQQLEMRVQLFLAEKTFYGCAGFNIDERVKITIAGHACLLILARSFSNFDEIRSILVYPDTYRVTRQERDGLVVNQSEAWHAGEASSQGRVVLAWSHCLEACQPAHPHNVILHEFAHQLDYLDGVADGAPPLNSELLAIWPQVMSQAYNDLIEDLEHQQRPWLDPYGATEPAEFFAVLTETFFQQPKYLRAQKPDVFNALTRFYRLDTTHLTPL